MLPSLLAVLGGAAGLGALLTPVLVHLTSRRVAVQSENAALIDALQEERDNIAARVEARDATIAALFDYVYRLRHWIVRGSTGEPPTMPEQLTVSAVRARIGSAP